MRIKEAQEIADKKKYILSEEARCDLSGSMDYCKVCKFACDCKCTLVHEDRVFNSTCGSAYNKYLKTKAKTK